MTTTTLACSLHQLGPCVLLQVTALTSQLSGLRVLCINYRLAPQHPFPAGLDDAVAVYRALLTDKAYKHSSIGLIGDSAGRGLRPLADYRQLTNSGLWPL
jgi:hypothetical protein